MISTDTFALATASAKAGVWDWNVQEDRPQNDLE